MGNSRLPCGPFVRYSHEGGQVGPHEVQSEAGFCIDVGSFLVN